MAGCTAGLGEPCGSPIRRTKDDATNSDGSSGVCRRKRDRPQPCIGTARLLDPAQAPVGSPNHGPPPTHCGAGVGIRKRNPVQIEQHTALAVDPRFPPVGGAIDGTEYPDGVSMITINE